jgi:hypothetical protein
MVITPVLQTLLMSSSNPLTLNENTSPICVVVGVGLGGFTVLVGLGVVFFFLNKDKIQVMSFFMII